jgi:hypothetical protein
MVARASYVKGASPRFAVSFGIRHIPYRCWHAKSTLLEHPRTFRWDTHTTAAVAAAASQSLHHAILDAESVPSFQDLFGSQGSVHHSSSGKVKVHVSIVQHVQYGQFLRLVGSAKQLGKWEAGYGPDLKWSEGDKWSIDVALAVGTYDFKFVLVHRWGLAAVKDRPASSLLHWQSAQANAAHRTLLKASSAVLQQQHMAV